MSSATERVVPSPDVGRRIIDAHEPGSGITVAADAPGRIQELRTALYAPRRDPTGRTDPNDRTTPDWDDATREVLAEKVAPQTIAGDSLPRVSPRLYARFQRGRQKLTVPPGETEGNWFDDLNTRPLNRIAAGLGTRVVQQAQELLMESAWAQVGEIRKANAALNSIKLGCFVSEHYHRMLAKLPIDRLTQVTRSVHGKIEDGPGRTLRTRVENSLVPTSALTPAFSRMTRLRARLVGAAPSTISKMVANGETFRDFRRPIAELGGITGLRPSVMQNYGNMVARRLGVQVEALTPELIVRRMTVKKTTADRLLDPTDQTTVKALSKSISGIAEQRVLLTADRMLGKGVRPTPAMLEALAGPLLALAAGGGDSAKAASKRLAKIETSLPPALAPTKIRKFKQIGVPKGYEDFGRLETRKPTGVLKGEAAKFTRFQTPDILANALRRQKATTATSSQIATGLALLYADINLGKLPGYATQPMLTIDKTKLLSAIEPKQRAKAYAVARLGGTMVTGIAADWLENYLFTPIMAAPRFERPMYQALADYDQNWLAPGLSGVPHTDFVTVLATNPDFIEAFMIGLSDEMGRELLWRGYPTDQRGTYFRRFWRSDIDEINEIHRFTGRLGSHFGGKDQTVKDDPLVVMVVRGELIRRYPDALMPMVPGIPGEDDKFGEPPQTGERALLFHAPLGDDMVCVGFNLTVSRLLADGSNWWFMVAEHPTATRFGLDVGTNPARRKTRNDLNWGGVPTNIDPNNTTAPVFLTAARGNEITDTGSIDPATGRHPKAIWPTDAGWVAQCLLQNPVRVMFFAKKLVRIESS